MKQTTEGLKVFVIIYLGRDKHCQRYDSGMKQGNTAGLLSMLTYSECAHPLYVLKYSCHHHLRTAALPITC